MRTNRWTWWTLAAATVIGTAACTPQQQGMPGTATVEVDMPINIHQAFNQPVGDLVKAKELGIEQQEVIRVCMQEGVPIYHGKIDKTLFQAQLQALGAAPQHH